MIWFNQINNNHILDSSLTRDRSSEKQTASHSEMLKDSHWAPMRDSHLVKLKDPRLVPMRDRSWDCCWATPKVRNLAHCSELTRDLHSVMKRACRSGRR